jgi:hypothetical protein
MPDLSSAFGAAKTLSDFAPPADRRSMRNFAWEEFDLDGLAAAVRSNGDGPDAARTIWAFEEGLRVARLDPQLLPYLLAATTCLVARVEQCSPRDVLESFFRRSVSDDEWRERYLPLFG